MFWTVPLTIIRSFSLYTQQRYMSYRFADSLQTVSKRVWHIPFLRVQWKTPDGGRRNCSETCRVSFQNKFEKLVHLVGFNCKKCITMHGHINIKHVTVCRGNLTYLSVLKEGSAFIFKDLPTLEGKGTVLFWDTGIRSINHDTTQDQNLQHQSHKNIRSCMMKVAFFL